jgi:hypothetical protein
MLGNFAPNPTALSKLISLEDVQHRRSLFCAEYDRCLDDASRRGWCSWSCECCELFAFASIQRAETIDHAALCRDDPTAWGIPLSAAPSASSPAQPSCSPPSPGARSSASATKSSPTLSAASPTSPSSLRADGYPACTMSPAGSAGEAVSRPHLNHSRPLKRSAGTPLKAAGSGYSRARDLAARTARAPIGCQNPNCTSGEDACAYISERSGSIALCAPCALRITSPAAELKASLQAQEDSNRTVRDVCLPRESFQTCSEVGVQAA